MIYKAFICTGIVWTTTKSISHLSPAIFFFQVVHGYKQETWPHDLHEHQLCGSWLTPTLPWPALRHLHCLKHTNTYDWICYGPTSQAIHNSSFCQQHIFSCRLLKHEIIQNLQASQLSHQHKKGYSQLTSYHHQLLLMLVKIAPMSSPSPMAQCYSVSEEGMSRMVGSRPAWAAHIASQCITGLWLTANTCKQSQIYNSMLI